MTYLLNAASQAIPETWSRHLAFSVGIRGRRSYEARLAAASQENARRFAVRRVTIIAVSSDIDQLLVATYQRRGVLGTDQRPVALSRECPCAPLCWKDEADARRPSMGAANDEMSPPWIGSRFSSGRVLVVLENLNDYGGWDLRPDAERGIRYLGRSARWGFAHGHRRLFGGGGYGGTAVWAQSVSYAALLLGRRGAMHVERDHAGRVMGSSLAEAMDLLAITQHVKCSPARTGDRSQPNPAMWSACGNHVLRFEIEILRPRDILVVGTGRNREGMQRLYEASSWRETAAAEHRTGRRAFHLSMYEAAAPFGAVTLAVVPHPAAAGAASNGLVNTFATLIASSS